LHVAHGVYDKESRTLEYRQLIKHPKYRDKWRHSAANEFSRLAQGVGDRIKGTNTINFIIKNQVPKGQTCTYKRFVSKLRPQKDEVDRTRLTVGGNLIDYPSKVSSPTADLTTFKLHVNDRLSTPGATNVMWDISNFYLNTPLDCPEYMKIHIDLFSQEIIDQYELHAKMDEQGFVYMEINKGMYGLPQSGILANQLLQKRLAPYGYHPVRHTPGLWRHNTKPTSFLLVVNDFLVKFVDKTNADQLLAIIRPWYPVKVDWSPTLFCGITVAWNYSDCTAQLSMPGYITSVLKELQHPAPKRPQFAPYPHQPRTYGQTSQLLPAPDTSGPLTDIERKRIPHIVGKLLYYA
jgi:hypothetical protein